MSQILNCPHCGMKFRATEPAPKSVRCPHCQGVVALTAAAGPAAPSAAGPLDAQTVEGSRPDRPAVPRYSRSWPLLALAVLLGVGVPGLLLALPRFGGEAPEREWLLYALAGGAALALVNLLIAAARVAPRLVRFLGLVCLNAPVYAVLVLLLLAVTGRVSLAALGLDDWRKVAPEDGRFTVQMPGQPQPHELPVEGLPAAMKLLRADLRARDQTYEVG